MSALKGRPLRVTVKRKEKWLVMMNSNCQKLCMGGKTFSGKWGFLGSQEYGRIPRKEVVLLVEKWWSIDGLIAGVNPVFLG